MTIVSISLGDKNVETLEALQEAFGLSNRSETIRLCLRLAEGEIRERMELEGDVEGVIIMVRNQHMDPNLDRILHSNERIIKTHLHSHLKDHKCLDVLVVGGQAEDLKEMLLKLRGKGMTDYIKFVRG